MTLLDLDPDTGALRLAAGAAVTRLDGDRYAVSDGTTTCTFDLASPVYCLHWPAARFADQLRAAAATAATAAWTGSPVAWTIP